MTLRAALAAGRPLVLDGGLATVLEALGHDLSDDRWSARLLEDDPAAVRAVHEAYLDAGARVLITASYQATGDKLLARSVELAQEARAARGLGPDDALVLGSVGPFGALLANGAEYTGEYGGIDAEVLRAHHEHRIRVLAEAGADGLACETVPRADEAGAIAAALDSAGAPDAWVSFTCRDGARTAAGDAIEEAVRAATASARVVAVGVNCTAPEHVAALLGRMCAVTGLPLVAYPNNGRTWNGAARAWSDGGADGLPGDTVREWAAAGASGIGGCCGLGPAAIRAVAGALG